MHYKLFRNASPRVLYFSLDCAEHAVHLCVLGTLKDVERELVELQPGWKYFSSCAVIANVLRDNCREFYNAWKQLYGVHEALQLARTLWPKCIAGRWGSIHMFEDRMLQCGSKKTFSFASDRYFLLICLFCLIRLFFVAGWLLTLSY